ncbi:MAG TPA: choice-of-anchor Q domain-containing protein, partial [Patescibacteria group bacterium]|nr:choice-of-anchor Q domain-containing protein [Patescibacteria group bacterium]
MAKFRVLGWTIWLIAALSGNVAGQGFIWPSGAAPCNGTLQQCVSGVIDNAMISIDTNAPTNVVDAPNADLLIARSLILRAAPGRRPVFPAGVGIVVNAGNAINVAIEGLVLRQGADIEVHAGTVLGTTSVSVERMRFEHLGVAGGGVSIENTGGSALQIRVRDNDYLRTGGAGNFSFVEASSGTIAGEIAFNRIDIPDGTSSAYGIIVGTTSTASAVDLVVAANRIRGSFLYGAICMAGGAPEPGKLFTSRLSLLSNVMTPAVRGQGTGICLFAGDHYVETDVINNTLVDLGTGLRVTTAPFGPTPPVINQVFGRFDNNLFAHNGTAVFATAEASALDNASNLFFGNGSLGSGFVPDPSTDYDDPRLFSRSAPYLLANSPAIGAGSNTSWPGPARWPSLDADGLRRVKGTRIDIGAHEYGDGWFDALATASTAQGNTLILDHPTTNAAPSARVFATPNFDLGSVDFNAPPGVYWLNANAQWRIFSEDISIMPLGAGFNVFSPAPPNVSGAFSDIGLFLQRLPASGVTNSSTLLDHPSTNDRQDAVLMVAQNWNPQDPPASTGVYNNSHVTLQYFADDRWRIANVSGNPMPNGAAFNVYAQPPSPSAFTHTAQPGNITGSSTVLSHPLIDGKPCAKLMVTSYFGNGMFDVDYSPARQRWLIYAGNGM